MRRSIAVLIALGSLLVATPAAAQGPPPPPERPTTTTTGGGTTGGAKEGGKPGQSNRRMGILASLGFGVNGCTDDLCDNSDPLLYVRLQGLFRVFHYLAVGLHLSFHTFHPDETPSGVDVSLWDVFIGPEFRGIYAWKKLDVWTGFALGYYRVMAHTSSPAGDSDWWSNAFGFAWGIGAQYFLIRSIALGLDFWLYKPVLTEACSDSGGGSSCSDVEDQDGVGITWAVGFTATFWIGR